MPIYHRLGDLPPKRHTQFRKPDGGLYHEQVFGTVGFEGTSSLLYHLQPPTQVEAVGPPQDISPKIAVENNLTMRKLLGFSIKPMDDFLDSRVPLLVNKDVTLGVAAPRHSLTDYFYKNAGADELLFIHKGSGKLRTAFGSIPFEYGDYLVIPRGMIYQIEFDTDNNRLLYLETH